jgi:20S proteasome alpha/beta subunit
MTIAAGFVCDDSVLLCADTLYSGTAKTHDKKVDSFDYPGGKVAFAIAGNSVYAWSAVNKLKEKLKKTADANLTPMLAERVLAGEYRRQIFSHPNREKDYGLPYWILLALWSNRHGVQLYVTDETSMNPVESFQCIGAGADLARYLIQPAFYSLMGMRGVWNLAAYALKAAKEYVDGCGGDSLFLVLENDGTIGVTSAAIPNTMPHQIENVFVQYESMTRHLLLSMANPDIDERLFWDVVLKDFAATLWEIKKQWSQVPHDWEEEFKKRNPRHHPSAARVAYLRVSMGLPPRDLPLLTDDPAEQPNPPQTKDDPQYPLPSPELPGGSDES